MQQGFNIIKLNLFGLYKYLKLFCKTNYSIKSIIKSLIILINIIIKKKV